MDLLVGLASLVVALWLTQQLKMPFPSNVVAIVLVALVVYVLFWSLAASIVDLLASVTRAASAVPVAVPVVLLLGIGIGYYLCRRRTPGGGDPFGSL